MCSLGRSRRLSGRLSAPHIRMIITCSPHLRWKVCLRQISRTTNGIQRAAAEVMITTPTLAAPSTRRLARRRAAVTCVMRTAMTRPTSTVALATTRHSTRREVTGGDRTSGEAGGRRSSGRTCTRARGPREFAGFSSALKKMVVCRRRCAASSLADPNMGPRTHFWAGPGQKKGVRPFVCATPSTAKPGPLACARVLGGFTYEVTFVRLLARGDPTCTPPRAVRAVAARRLRRLRAHRARRAVAARTTRAATTSSPGRTAVAVWIGRAAAVLGPVLTRAHDDRQYHNRYMAR